MGNSESQDTTISCDVDFIATRLYGKLYDELKPGQKVKVDSYQTTMKANQNKYSGVLELTVEQRDRLYRLAEVTYKINRSEQSVTFDSLFDLEDEVSILKQRLSDVKERPFGILMKARRPQLREIVENIQVLEAELKTLENEQKETEKKLSNKNKKLYKEYQEINGMNHLIF